MSESYIYKEESCNMIYLSLPQILKGIALERPDQEAAVFYLPSGKRDFISYSEWYNKAEAFAKGLLSLGFEKESIVAISSMNCKEWLICAFGTQMAGFIPLYFTFWNPSGEDVVHLLNKVGKCAAIIVSCSDFDCCKLLAEKDEYGKSQIMDKILTLQAIIVLDSFASATSNVEYICKKGKTEEQTLPNISSDDICGIFLTSGSTGHPKAVPLTHRTAYKNGYNIGKALMVLPGEKFYDDKPFSWLASYPSSLLATKSTRITTSDVMIMKSVDDINKLMIKLVSKEKCVSAFLHASCILDLISCDIPDLMLRCVVIGGQPVDRESAKMINKITRYFSNVYGTTETGCICVNTVDKEDDYNFYEVGFPVHGTEIKIVDDNKCTLPVQKSGEIYVRARDRFLGYLNDEGQNELYCEKSGWCKTDDVGFIKPNGCLVVTGRKSDTMIIGDDLVSPSYLESILRKHGSVRNAHIYPVYNKKTFQEACAAILLKDGYSVTGEELKEFFRSQIGKYSNGFLANLHIPNSYLFYASFPLTHNGKLDKCALNYSIKTMFMDSSTVHFD